MLKTIVCIFCVLGTNSLVSVAMAQTAPTTIQTASKSFYDGYRDGFKKAYPFGMCPIPPIPPIGKNTYGDGYGMGYSAGMSAKPR